MNAGNIDQFIALTGSSREEALGALEAANDNLEVRLAFLSPSPPFKREVFDYCDKYIDVYMDMVY